MSRVPWSQRPMGQDKFRLRVNESMRIAILDDQPEMVRGHYFGRQYECTTPDCAFCERAIEWKERFGLYILVYSQDNGVLKAPLDGHIVPWFFGSDKYLIIHAWSIAGDVRSRDIICTCVEENFQRFAMSQVDGAAWVSDPAMVQKVQTAYKALPRDLSSKIATRLTRPDAVTVLERGIKSRTDRGGGRDQRGPAQPQAAPWSAPAAVPLPPAFSMSPPPLTSAPSAALPQTTAPPPVPPLTAAAPALPLPPPPPAQVAAVDQDRLRKLLEV